MFGFRKNLWLMALFVMLLAVIGLYTLTIAMRSERAPTQDAITSQKHARKVPPFKSEIEGVFVSNAMIEGNVDGIGADGAILRVTVQNNTPFGVTAVTLRNGNHGFGRDGGQNSDTPQVIIDPYGSLTLASPLANIGESDTITVTAVAFDNGEQKGSDTSWINIQRAKAKEQRKAQKDQGAQ